MSATQEVSYGTKLEVNTTGSTWVEIGEIKTASGPNYQRKEIPLPALRDAVTRKKSGRLNLGAVEITMGYNKTGYDFLLGYIKGKTAKPWRLTMPEGSTEAFNAEVIGLTKSAPDDDVVTMTATIMVDGDSTWTPAA